MRFNVAQLLKESTGAARQYDLSEDITGIDEALKVLGPLKGQVKLIRTTEGILTIGQLRTEIELTCSRCLEPFAAPVAFTLQEEFRPSIDITTGAQLPVTTTADQESTIIDEHHIIDLTEVVRQEILLALPMHPLCRPHCAGLCDQCGQNLNQGPCDCQRPLGDPRLAALKELL